MKSNERRLRVLESCVRARAEAGKPPVMTPIDLSPERIAAMRNVFREAALLEGIGPESTDGEIDAAVVRMRGAEARP